MDAIAMHSISGARWNASEATGSAPYKTTNQQANDNARSLHWRTRHFTGTLAISAHAAPAEALSARSIEHVERECRRDRRRRVVPRENDARTEQHAEARIPVVLDRGCKAE